VTLDLREGSFGRSLWLPTPITFCFAGDPASKPLYHDYHLSALQGG